MINRSGQFPHYFDGNVALATHEAKASIPNTIAQHSLLIKKAELNLI